MKMTVFTTYTTTSGVYTMLYTECMVAKWRKVDQSTIFVSFLNFWTYFMSEWAYRKQHLFKNIFKLPTPSYTRYSFLKHLNSDDQSDSDHGVSLLSNIRTKLQFINFFISFTNICHLYMFTQILPVNKIDRMQRN